MAKYECLKLKDFMEQFRNPRTHQASVTLETFPRELKELLKRGRLYKHKGQTAFVAINLEEGKKLGNAPLEGWSSEGIESDDKHMAALSRINGLHFYADLGQQPDYRLSNYLSAKEQKDDNYQPRLLLVIAIPERGQKDLSKEYKKLVEKVDQLEAYLKEREGVTAGWDVHSLETLNQKSLQEEILEGIDGLIMMGHGESGDTVVGNVVKLGETIVSVKDFQGMLLSNPRKLRFACFLSCSLVVGLHQMLCKLADENKLHPHFGGILMRGEPEIEFAASFTSHLMKFLAEPKDKVKEVGQGQSKEEQASFHQGKINYPLAYAVREARRACCKEASHISTETETLDEITKPRLVHFTPPFVRPFPTGNDLELEKYLVSLAKGMTEEIAN